MNGTAGEGLSQTTEERKEVVEQWVRVSGGRYVLCMYPYYSVWLSGGVHLQIDVMYACMLSL